MSKNYPEAIYETRDGLTMTLKQRERSGGKARRYAYDLGYEHGKQAQIDLTGWSNLTEAIKAGERIDWERLDGVEAKCVHSELGALTHKLERTPHDGGEASVYYYWTLQSVTSTWGLALSKSWNGLVGWSLWVKGDLPIHKVTADQLEPGTCFRARYQKGEYSHTYIRAQVLQVPGGTFVFCFNGQFTHVRASYDPAEIEVLEVYGVGTFQKQEEDA